MKVLKDYVVHGDYLIMQNHLQAIGQDMLKSKNQRGESTQNVIFPNIQIAIGWFKNNQKLTIEESETLFSLVKNK